MRNIQDFKTPSREELLALLGLRPRRSPVSVFFGSLGLLGLGALLGASAALLSAPKPGRALREELGSRINGAARRMSRAARREAEAART